MSELTLESEGVDRTSRGEDVTAGWRNVQVYYYDDDRIDDLVLDAVCPLFARLAPRPSFFVRHWLRGPHVRLRVHTTADDFDRVVVPAVGDLVGGWLAAHSSTVCLDEAAVLAVHARLAEWEREPGPLSPFYPDNSVQYLPCDRRIDVVGSATAADLLEGFSADTAELTFAMLADIRNGTSRLNVALDLMWATAYAAGSVTRGYVSYRSHSEGRIMTAADPSALRSFLEQQYRSRSAALVERLGRVLGTLHDGCDDVPFVREWVQAMTRLRAQATPLIADGAVELPVPARGVWLHGSELLRHSAFHRALASNPAHLEMMRTSVRFHVYRVLVNCCYLHLTRLGIRPFERSLLGFLAAETVEERFGVSAVESVTAS